MLKSLSLGAVFFAAGLSGLACSGGSSGAVLPTAKPRGPSQELLGGEFIGTSAPGDVWRISVADGGLQLVGDNGTPGTTADDLRASGSVVPTTDADVLEANITQTNEPVRVPLGRLVALTVPGFGVVMRVGTATTVMALTPGPCAVPTSGRFRTVEAAASSRPDGRRTFSVPSRARFAPFEGGTAFELAIDVPDIPSDSTVWRLSNVTCAADGTVKVGAVSTPFSRALNPPYAWSAPVPSMIAASFAPGGQLLLDFGRGFGGVVAVPEAVAWPTTEADKAELVQMVRNRKLEGVLTFSGSFQPVGAEREDPSVVRTMQTRVQHMVVTLIDGQSGTADIEGLATPQNVSLTTNSDGTASLTFDYGSANALVLNGAVAREGRGLGYALADGIPRGNGPIRTLFETPVAGQELYRGWYSAWLQLKRPVQCVGAALPGFYTEAVRQGAVVNSTRGLAVDRLAIKALHGAPGLTGATGEIKLTNGQTLVGSSTQVYLLDPGTRVQLDPAPPNGQAGFQVKLVCGPEYPWPPPAPGMVTSGVDTQNTLGFAVRGTYVVAFTPVNAPDTVNPTANPSFAYVVFEVN